MIGRIETRAAGQRDSTTQAEKLENARVVEERILTELGLQVVNAIADQAELPVRKKTHTLLNTLDQVDALIKLNKSTDTIGLYGKCYQVLITVARELMTEDNVPAGVVHEQLVPLILYLQAVLLSSQPTMPLAQFENEMLALGYSPDPIYTTTG